MLRFQHPELLWLLLAVPVLAAGFVALHLWNRRLLRLFVTPVLWPALLADASAVKRGVKQGLLLLAIACLVLALANPQIGTRLEEVKREGIDLFVALDVSLSMKAEDVRPSRLEKAKRDVSQLLRKLAGDRVGLIVFAGDAFVQFPLTADYAAADLFISTVDVESVPTPGTMIGSAIEKALDSFTKDQPTQKAIVIVSDGENTEGDVLGAVEKASAAGVKVYTIGMGTLEGGPIPVGASDYKRDMDGNVVVSKLDESMLRQVASATAGRYLRETSGGNAIDDVFKELSSLEKTEFGAKQVTGYESRYQVPLAFAILFLFIELLLSERRGAILRVMRRSLRGGPVPTATLMALLAFAASASSQTVRDHVQEGNKLYQKGKFSDAEAAYRQALGKDPTSGVSHFNLGDSHFRQDRHEEAARAFGNSAMNLDAGPERSAGYYNMGNALFKASKLDESIEAYKRALRNDPDNEDARHNLEVARRKRQEQQQQKRQKDQKQDQKQDQQQQQQQQQPQDQQQDQQKQDQQQNQQQQSQQDRTRQQQQKHQMNKEEAERMLEALRNNEKDIQKKLQKRPAARVRVEKDW
ncbi:MAG: VWA domain-containing protein [Bacteroidetes bacterium]|jgi:Ca-activated chloride channel family protein|nr:VWA domain-containing protein [Bacteroidota bacterium]